MRCSRRTLIVLALAALVAAGISMMPFAAKAAGSDDSDDNVSSCCDINASSCCDIDANESCCDVEDENATGGADLDDNGSRANERPRASKEIEHAPKWIHSQMPLQRHSASPEAGK